MNRFRWFSVLLAYLVVGFTTVAMPQILSVEAQDHYKQGKQYAKANEKDKAILEFRRAVDLEKNYVDAHRALQDLILERGKTSRE